jgi:hypothetical protein
MSKRLIALSLCLMLGGGAVTAIAVNTAAAQAPAARKPVLLAQNTPANPGRGRAGPARTPPTPQQGAERRADACQNLSALAAGRLAYLETRLDLTQAQRALFSRWRDVRLTAAKAQATACAERPARGPAANAQATPPSPADRMARQETRLRQRLAELQAERPALEALYNSLTPQQRERFVPFENGRRGGLGFGPRGPRMAMTMRGMGPRGGMGGMMRHGPGPGGNPDRMPPPPAGEQPPPPAP